jgi:hypothetical protein
MAHPFQSDSVGAIFTALAKAQSEIQNPTKNATNPHFKSKYSTLDEGLNVIREALSAVGICVFQRTYVVDTVVMLETVLGHSSGEWLSSNYPVITMPYKPQDGLSSLTYARRGALFAAVGIAGEDDDGNAANKTGPIAKSEAQKASENESSAILAQLLESLKTCETESQLAAWAITNKNAKNKLVLSDQAIIVREYKASQQNIIKE